MEHIMITGGSRGIGLGLVQELVKTCKVVFSVRNEEDGKSVMETLGTYAQQAHYVLVDVRDKEQVEHAARTVKELIGHVDVLINNAGIMREREHGVLETSPEEFIKTFDVNVAGALRMVQAFVPLMQEGGRVINISSLLGQMRAMRGSMLAYRVSKSALNALTLVCSHELREKGIQTCAISPGWVRTDMGGAQASFSVEESVEGIIPVIIGDQFCNGAFLRNGKIIDW